MKLIDIILGNTNLEDIFYGENFSNPSCTTYIKDLNGKYLHCNDVMAKYIGCEKASDIIGGYDPDFLPITVANMLKVNDTEVITSATCITFNEAFESLAKEKLIANSIKLPYRNSKQKIMGIMGFSIISTLKSLKERAGQEYNLSTRQLECLYHLVKGKSMKQIANILSLSLRTVEHYLEAARVKMHCANRSQLIEKALRIPYIKSLL
jgi:DNA-binding CsgD family transcriptional regulator